MIMVGIIFYGLYGFVNDYRVNFYGLANDIHLFYIMYSIYDKEIPNMDFMHDSMIYNNYIYIYT